MLERKDRADDEMLERARLKRRRARQQERDKKDRKKETKKDRKRAYTMREIAACINKAYREAHCGCCRVTHVYEQTRT